MTMIPYLGALNYWLSSRSRQLKFDLFSSLMKPWPGCSILNLGAAPPHLGGALMHAENNRIEQPEQDARWRNFRVVGCNLNGEDMRRYRRAHQASGFGAVIADGCRLPFPDQSFDVVFSNAVIEHLTPDGQRRMASEILRVGRSWFVTTPNFWYPVEMHHKLPLFQFLPRSAQERIRRRYRTWPDGEPIHLLTGREIARLLPGSRVLKTRVTFFPETLIAFCPPQTRQPGAIPTAAVRSFA
jgi:Methyltransferase domain